MLACTNIKKDYKIKDEVCQRLVILCCLTTDVSEGIRILWAKVREEYTYAFIDQLSRVILHQLDNREKGAQVSIGSFLISLL